MVTIVMIKKNSAKDVRYGPAGSYMATLCGLLVKFHDYAIVELRSDSKAPQKFHWDWNIDSPTFRSTIKFDANMDIGRVHQEWRIEKGLLIQTVEHIIEENRNEEHRNHSADAGSGNDGHESDVGDHSDRGREVRPHRSGGAGSDIGSLPNGGVPEIERQARTDDGSINSSMVDETE